MASTALSATPAGESAGKLSPTAVLLVETAERLFGESGPEGVSLRQIGIAAGQSNKFVVQYYFGNKQTLLEAIFAHRLPRIDSLRESLLAQVIADDEYPGVRSLLEVLMRPLAVEARSSDSRYVSFLSRGRFNEMHAQRWWQGSVDRVFSAPGTKVAEMILSRLSHLPAKVRLARLQLVLGNCLFALASYEQEAEVVAGSAGSRSVPFEFFVTDMLDGAALALAAPLSDAASMALKESGKW